jgi:pimeloyl-ACP methyl ester carboxylesterase
MAVHRVREIELAYDDVGAGVPVVLLHGFPFNRTLWREQVEALGGSYRVVAPDLRGHGETTATTEPATMEEMARDVAALLDEMQIGRPVLGGLSMGGYVALAFCRLFPRRVRALMLADTRAQADTEDGKRAREETAGRARRRHDSYRRCDAPETPLSYDTHEAPGDGRTRARDDPLDEARRRGGGAARDG